MDKLDLLEGFFRGVKDPKAFIADKDTANAMVEDFKDATIEQWWEQMYEEMESAASDQEVTDDDMYQFAVGMGVLSREFMEYKLKNK